MARAENLDFPRAARYARRAQSTHPAAPHRAIIKHINETLSGL
jgi:hypothetical protein